MKRILKSYHFWFLTVLIGWTVFCFIYPRWTQEPFSNHPILREMEEIIVFLERKEWGYACLMGSAIIGFFYYVVDEEIEDTDKIKKGVYYLDKEKQLSGKRRSRVR